MKCSAVLRGLGLLTWVAGLGLAAPVQALPPEYLASAAFHPTDPNVLVVRYESNGGGFLFSRDGGRTFRAHPSRAFYDYGLIDRVPFRVAGDGKLLIGLSDAYMEDDGNGCAISAKQTDKLSQTWIADIAIHPKDPEVAFLASTGKPYDSKHVGLWKRDKAGTLTALGVSEPAMDGVNSIFVRGMIAIARAASMDGVRIVQTITRQTYTAGQMFPTPSSALRFSDDLGATWTEHPIPDPGKTNGSARLLAVSASEPMKIVVALEVKSGTTDLPDPVLVSSDNGATFTSYSNDVLTVSQSLLLPTGQLLVADSGSPGGLYMADAIGMPLRKVFDDTVKCVVQQPGSGKIFVCKGFEVGLFDLAKSEVCGTFQLNETLSLVSCPGADLASNKKVTEQLCNAWCGPLHYSYSPLCSIYNTTTPTCGLASRTYDTQAGWAEPPGPGASPRCAGYEAPAGADAGTPDAGTAADAGSSGSDAGVDHDAAHGGGTGGKDSGDEPEGGAEVDAGAGVTKPKKDCHVAWGGSSDPASGLFVLSLFSLLALRRRRR